MPVVRAEALAKINLGLYVLYRRPDHFHEIRTVFQTIALSDRIEVEYRRARRSSVEIACNIPELAGDANIAARAARLLLETADAGGRVRVQIEKRIPAGAGMGGGSSDAAAILLALGSMLRPRPSFETLLRLAGMIGSDVPFFLVGGRALGLGRGEEIYPLPDGSPQSAVIVAPRQHVSTAEAYRRLSPRLTEESWKGKIDRFCSSVCALEPGALPGPKEGPARYLQTDLENDFESVVFQMHPELKKVKARLARLGARPALLCGSGSALFGMFTDRRQALRACDSLELEDARSFVVQTVSRTGYRARWRKWLGES